MYRQLIFRGPGTALVIHRGFSNSATFRALPALDQSHTIDKHRKKDHSTPNMDSVKAAKKEREAAAKKSMQEKKDTTKQGPRAGPSAGIGMQVLTYMAKV